MMIPIVPIRGISTTCFQDLIISVATYWEREYVYLFAESLNVRFEPEPGRLLGAAIHTEKRTSLDWLFRFTGMELRQRSCADSSEALAVVRSELAEGRPVAIEFDAYWNPWGNKTAYQQVHGEHICLVVGIEEEGQSLVCIDPTFSSGQERLPFDHFRNGNRGGLITVSRHDPVELEPTELIGRIASRYLENRNAEALHAIAAAIRDSASLAEEFEQVFDFWASPLFQRLDTIYYARHYLCETTALLLLRCPESSLNQAIERIWRISEQLTKDWDVVQKLLIKHYGVRAAKKEERALQQLSQWMKANAVLEEKLEAAFETLAETPRPVG
ncbi:BtrH N-terminal domain-containing protein [Paenibacillus xanthanilyticus]|uniref:BtrH N-terminal domain-containing protein n=1 Tax=Paenibacillus xanthanilyticus TaxID=1783531 RepID=A0ABV8K5X4_9BACL